MQLELADHLLRGRAAASGPIAEDRIAGNGEDQRANRELEDTVGLQLRLDVEVALGAQLESLERFPEVGASLLYFPFRFSTCLAHSASSFSVVIVLGGGPIFSMPFPTRPRTTANTRKSAVSMPATSA